ncbi:aspartyl-phosphate phosphatase Spo0E family protein [Peribacillus simplex]|uniref:aspartyl-phosphate phosphatase Spo0E family protein n=1 Tax=Peribacillus TaxID=2675229 RepID=UPI0017836668|nr:aspartyl-phosphate phosphatase Spo0E family protein [Brevibacillus sp. JNUCC-41]QOS88273.1 aspartyl-phosphate phosphatase Spo0E family protein [Brevibacillus sp. JNUCC-41]
MPCRKVTIEKIEEKRKEMINLAAIYGLSSLLTVQASQELDTLLNALTSKRECEHFYLQKAYRYF